MTPPSVVAVTVLFDPSAEQKITAVHHHHIPQGSSVILWTLETAAGSPAAQFRPPTEGDGGVHFESQDLLDVGSPTPGTTTWEIPVHNENHTGVNQSVGYAIFAGVPPDFHRHDPTLVVVPDPPANDL